MHYTKKDIDQRITQYTKELIDEGFIIIDFRTDSYNNKIINFRKFDNDNVFGFVYVKDEFSSIMIISYNGSKSKQTKLHRIEMLGEKVINKAYYTDDYLEYYYYYIELRKALKKYAAKRSKLQIPTVELEYKTGVSVFMTDKFKKKLEEEFGEFDFDEKIKELSKTSKGRHKLHVLCDKYLFHQNEGE